MFTVARHSLLASNSICRQALRRQFQQQLTFQRYRSSTPLNTAIVFVPQQESWVVERMGKFNRILDPGLNFLIPILDKVKYVQSLKEIAIEIPEQSAVTADNVTLSIDGVLYLRVVDPYKASYGVEDPEFAITQLAQTTMRSEIGKIALDSVFKERESLNISIVESLNGASTHWGIQCFRYEIRDIDLPPKVKEAMQMQVEAERKKRAKILESEGMRDAEINVAEGQKRSVILRSEAEKIEQINRAEGEAKALLRKSEAKARALQFVGQSLRIRSGSHAASLAVAEQYVNAFSKLAKTNNTLILSSDANDVSRMVAQALQVYKSISQDPQADALPEQIEDKFTDDLSSLTRDNGEYFSDQENHDDPNYPSSPRKK